MNYGNIKYNDISNGPGIRTSLFVSGCRIHCNNCFNKMTWDFLFGKPFTIDVQNEIIESLKSPYITGLTILGGEPFEKENQESLYPFIKRVREEFPDKSIWMFSGYTYEVIKNGKQHFEYTDKILELIDVLVDGPFVEDLKDITLKFRGSRNQRIIDVKETLALNKVVLNELNA